MFIRFECEDPPPPEQTGPHSVPETVFLLWLFQKLTCAVWLLL